MTSKKATFLHAVLAACWLTVTAALADHTSRSHPLALTDGQLDEITAGTTAMEKILFNSGNAFHEDVHQNGTHFMLINSPADVVDTDHAIGVRTTTINGNGNNGTGTMVHCIGGLKIC